MSLQFRHHLTRVAPAGSIRSRYRHVGQTVDICFGGYRIVAMFFIRLSEAASKEENLAHGEKQGKEASQREARMNKELSTIVGGSDS